MGILITSAPLYANAVHESGAPLDSCICFIDCTKVKITRPGGHCSNQRSVYSGDKRLHCLSYQSITIPEGLIYHLYGPEVGRHHDLTLLRKSNLLPQLETTLKIGDRQFYLYGDSAYTLKPWIQVPFSKLPLSGVQLEFNRLMSTVRVPVEWHYKDLKQIWKRNDISRGLHVRQCPVGLLYRVSALLLNFKSCLEKGDQIANYFKCVAPEFTEYINL